MPNAISPGSQSPRWSRGPVPVRRAFEDSSGRMQEKLKAARKDAPVEQADRSLRCRACGHEIACDHDRISMRGAHEHDYTNPHGIRFHIGCFCEAPGAVEIGQATVEHTWFAGYRWRIMLCSQCGTHLGWSFRAEDWDRFYGLILDRLIRPQ